MTPDLFPTPLDIAAKGSRVSTQPCHRHSLLRTPTLQPHSASLRLKTHHVQLTSRGRGVKSRFHLLSTEGSHFSSTPHSPHHPPPLSSSSFFNTLPGLATPMFFFPLHRNRHNSKPEPAPAPQTQPGPRQTQEKHGDMERNVQDTYRLPSTSDPSRYCSKHWAEGSRPIHLEPGGLAREAMQRPSLCSTSDTNLHQQSLANFLLFTLFSPLQQLAGG